MASVMVVKAERNLRMAPWLNPKEQPSRKGVFSSHSPKEYSMVKVQRSSPGRRVEPQANGGRKIQLLYENIGCRYDLYTIETRASIILL